MQAMIEIKNVSKTYKNGVHALRNINLTIGDGEFCFIVGRSGSGKSTLVRLLTKELEPTEGEILVNELNLQHMKRRHVPKYRRRLGVVFQDFRLLEDRSVYENVAFAELIAGRSTAEIRKDVPEILEKIGLGEKGTSFPRELSGGEQQRTAIARALINRPEILIADEPTGNLDHENAVGIMQLLESIHQQGTTVIVITHDLEMVRRMQKRTVHMSKGEILSEEAPALCETWTAGGNIAPEEAAPAGEAPAVPIMEEASSPAAPMEKEDAAPAATAPAAPMEEAAAPAVIEAELSAPAVLMEEAAAPVKEEPAASAPTAPIEKEVAAEETSPALAEAAPPVPMEEKPAVSAPAAPPESIKPVRKEQPALRRGLPGAHRPHRVPHRNGGKLG